MSNEPDDVKPLSRMKGYEVAKDEPDPRGWTVVARDGQRIGTVKDLLVDPADMKVKYLAVEDAADHERSLRVPARPAELDAERHQVIVGQAPSGERVRARDAGRDEREGSAGRAGGGHAAGREERNQLTRAEEELRIGKRRVDAGEVVVGKHVETVRVSEPVTVERERVRIERRPADRAAGSAELRDDEIRVPIVEEELVVEKRAVVKEELVISKERTTDTETVDAELRKERIDVEGERGAVLNDDDRKRGRT